MKPKTEIVAMLTTLTFLTPTGWALITHQNEIVQNAGLACLIFAALAVLAIIAQAFAWLMYRFKPIPPQTGEWKTATCQVLRICDMDDDHLVNTILFLKRRQTYSGKKHELTSSMVLEIERRKRLRRRRA